MKIFELVNDYKAKGIQNTKIAPNKISEYLNETIEIKKYLPFRDKREIAEMVVAQNVELVDGCKKNNSISQYISFVISSIVAHTNLEVSDDPFFDYDALAECGLLPHLIQEFHDSHNELDILLKMALADEMVDNNLNIIVGKFLNGVLDKLDIVASSLGKKVEGLDMRNLLGDGINKESIAQLTGLLDKLNIK